MKIKPQNVPVCRSSVCGGFVVEDFCRWLGYVTGGFCHKGFVAGGFVVGVCLYPAPNSGPNSVFGRIVLQKFHQIRIVN